MESNYLSALVGPRLKNPVIKFFYTEFQRLGMERRYLEFFALLPNSVHVPLLRVYTAHVTKEKALITYSLCLKVLGSPYKASVLGFVVDLLWLLSLIYDDIVDEDDRRAGLTSAWKEFGEKACQESMKVAFTALCRLVQEYFGAEAAQRCQELVQKSIDSLGDHKNLALTSPLGEVTANYYVRSSFHDRFAVEAIFGIGDWSAEKERALEALTQLNLAGQILNDLKDFAGSDWFGRDSLTDARAGLVTYPIVWLYSQLDEESRRVLESLYGTDSEQLPILLKKFFVIHDLHQNMAKRLRDLYEGFIQAISSVLCDDPEMAYCLLWYQYKLAQVVTVCAG